MRACSHTTFKKKTELLALDFVANIRYPITVA